MPTYLFSTSHEGNKFEVEGETLQSAFESLQFNASDYEAGEYEDENLTGKRIDVWGWENDERHDWIAYFK